MATLEQAVPAGPAKTYQLSVRRLAVDDDCLAIAYLRAKSEGLLPYFFWQTPPKSVREFIDWANQQVIVGCFASPTVGPTELAGFGAISSVKERCGRRHGDTSELFFRDFHLTHTSEFARLLLDWAFTEGKMDTLWGMTPSQNLPALRFMKAVGFEFSEPIRDMCCWQDKPCSGIISWMTREMWELQRSKQQ
jgi:RimJ/RimL family protein N-acetyltransferase